MYQKNQIIKSFVFFFVSAFFVSISFSQGTFQGKWDITRGNPSIKIGVLDSGIPMINGNLSHPDLDDATKYLLGGDYISPPSDMTDECGHGSHVLGIISAEANNNEGIAGIASDCKSLIVQVFDFDGEGTTESFHDGVINAVDNGVRVINYSGVSGWDILETEQQAVVYANSHSPSCLIVAAAGNIQEDDQEYPVKYPAAFSGTYENVMAISATNHNDSYNYSYFGSEINVCAPGGYRTETNIYFDSKDIYSTVPSYDYWMKTGLYQHPEMTYSYSYAEGSSMATPHVTGLAALIFSVNSSLSPLQVRTIIETTADDLGDPGKDDLYGNGRINAYEALKYTIENYGGTIGGSGETITFHEDILLKAVSPLLLLRVPS